MSLLNIANLAFGLASAGAQNSAQLAAQRAARREQDRLLALQESDYLDRKGYVNQLDAEGAFDPTTRISKLRDAFKINGQIAQNNAAGALRTAGYRPGDSAFQTTAQDLSESGRVGLAQAELNTADQARRDRMQALQFASPSNTLSGLNVYGQREQDAQNSMVNPAGLVQSYLAARGGSDLARLFRRSQKSV